MAQVGLRSLDPVWREKAALHKGRRGSSLVGIQGLGSGGLNNWRNHGDNQGYYIVDRGY